MSYVLAYAIAVVVFLAVDLAWLGLIAKGFYADRLGGLLRDKPRWGVAIAFYALYVAGLVYFAIAPAMASGDWQAAALNGALFGFFTYLTYDFTNLAVLKGYDPLVAVVDTLWGTALGATVAGVTTVVLAVLG